MTSTTLKTRLNANTGLWCSFLLPIVLYKSFKPLETIFEETVVYHLQFSMLLLSMFMAVYSVGYGFQYIYYPRSEGKTFFQLLKESIIFDLFERNASKNIRLKIKKESKSNQHPTNDICNNSFCSIGSKIYFIIFPLILLILRIRSFVIISSFIGSMMIYIYALPLIFKKFPRSFSFGEGSLVLQSIILINFHGILSLYHGIDDPSTMNGSFAIIAKFGYLSCFWVCVLPLLPYMDWTKKYILPIGVVFLFGITIPSLFFVLKRNVIFWMIETITSSNNRTFLMILWSVCVITSLIIVKLQQVKASTRVRKLFHGLMVIICVSGIILDPNLTYLSSVVALSLFSLLEALRYYDIQPFSYIIKNSFSIFLDEKDGGNLILTHIYLLVGCTLPLWIVSDLEDPTVTMKLLSGVLAIGIGDSAASICGSLFGKIKFPDSEKSLEGTMSSILVQMFFIWCLMRTNLITVYTEYNQILSSITFTAVVEALTNQIDNLVLPLIMFMLL